MRNVQRSPSNPSLAMSEKPTQDRFRFFRESGWLTVATLGGGLAMWAVHLPAQKVPDGDYGAYTSLLALLNLMIVPALGLQSVFAQQTASARDPESRQALAVTTHRVVRSLLGLWGVMGVAALLGRNSLLEHLQLNHGLPLVWLWVSIGMTLVIPVFQGILQGREDFGFFGLGLVLNGVGRFVSVALFIWVLHFQLAGAMAGVAMGMTIMCIVAAWRVGGWRERVKGDFAWRDWLARVVPLTIGLGTSMFLSQVDMLVVRSRFDPAATDLYGAAGVIGRALLFFTIPITMVLFPKIAKLGTEESSKTVVLQAVGATITMGTLAALGATLLPWLPIRILYASKPEFAEAARFVPWFAWGMLPLTVGNVLINQLMARGDYRVVPGIALIAVSYAGALKLWGLSFERVIGTLGLFSVLYCLVALVYSLRAARRRPESPASQVL